MFSWCMHAKQRLKTPAHSRSVLCLSAWKQFASGLSKMRSVNILIRLRVCAGWSESLPGAYVQRYVYWCSGSGQINWRLPSLFQMVGAWLSMSVVGLTVVLLVSCNRIKGEASPPVVFLLAVPKRFLCCSSSLLCVGGFFGLARRGSTTGFHLL